MGGHARIGGEIWGVPASQVPPDGTGHGPPAVLEASSDGAQETRHVVCNLHFYGFPDHRTHALKLIATADAGARFAQWGRGGARTVWAGQREVLLFDREGGTRSAYWVEQGAWVTVHADGVAEDDLVRFISELYLV